MYVLYLPVTKCTSSTAKDDRFNRVLTSFFKFKLQQTKMRMFKILYSFVGDVDATSEERREDFPSHF